MDDRIATFINNAEEYRQSRGISVPQFSKLLEIHRSYWYRVVSGERHPGVELLQRLGALDTTLQQQLHELFDDNQQKATETHQIKQKSHRSLFSIVGYIYRRLIRKQA